MKRTARYRRGLTLLESLIYVGVAGVLIPVALHSTFKAVQGGSDAREHAQGLASFERLARQFRDDVREAKTAAVVEGKKDLVLTMPDQRRIEYSANDSAVERTQSLNKSIEAHDSFELSNVIPAGVEVRSEPAEAVLKFRVLRGGPLQETQSERAFNITATVGRNHRFERHE